MNKLLTALSLAFAVLALPAHAADAASAAASGPTKQQSKMATCSADFKATGKAGSERQAFMSECLKNKPVAATKQQGKMATCSADFKATGKPGTERQAFMKECLSK